MPIVIDPRTKAEIEVSEAQLQRLRADVESDRRNGVSVLEKNGGPPTMALYDAVDGTRTKALEVNMANLLLQEITFKCSACRFTTVHEGQVAAHVRQVREQSAKHARARLAAFTHRDGEFGSRCTGCSVTFRARKDSGDQHLSRVKQDTATHQEAIGEVVMYRFSQTQGEVRVLGARHAADSLPAVKTVNRKARNGHSNPA